MARNPQTSADNVLHASGTQASTHDTKPPADAGLPGVQAWIHGQLAAPKKVVDSLLDMQRQWLKTASMGNETLSLELKELQEAKDPMQFASVQIALVSQQLEICTRQVAAVVQQIYDAQLLWMGQWDDKRSETPATPSLEQANQSALSALGRMQDEWLKVTQNWIDSVNSASRAHH